MATAEQMQEALQQIQMLTARITTLETQLQFDSLLIFRFFSFIPVFFYLRFCLVARVSTGSAVQQTRVGVLSPMPSCLGIGGHPSGSRQGHPRYTGARTAGRPWVARQDQTADTLQTVSFHVSCFFVLAFFSLFLSFSEVLYIGAGQRYSARRGRDTKVFEFVKFILRPKGRDH